MKGNVLVVGDSGVGKSTLINSVLGLTYENGKLKAGKGKHNQSPELVRRPHDSESSDMFPFYLIDTIGFDFTGDGKKDAIKAIKKWSKESTKKENQDKQINAIWLCVDGTRGRLMEYTLDSLIEATAIYKSVPIIVVITKSYSTVEIPQNIEMVRDYLSENKILKDNMPQIIPVLAEAYPITEELILPVAGLDELVEKTNNLMDKGLKAAQRDIAEYKRSSRKFRAQAIVIGSALAGAAKTFVKINAVSDSSVLNTIEKTELLAIAKVFDLEGKDELNTFIAEIISKGGAIKIAHLAQNVVLDFLKLHPKFKIAASAVNAIIAASIIVAIGEISISAFNSVASGEKSMNETQWINDIMDENLGSNVKDKIQKIFDELPETPSLSDVTDSIKNVFSATTKGDECSKKPVTKNAYSKKVQHKNTKK